MFVVPRKGLDVRAKCCKIGELLGRFYGIYIANVQPKMALLGSGIRLKGHQNIRYKRGGRTLGVNQRE
jgi:hypothetical protein